MAVGPLTKNGKVVSADVTDGGSSISNFLNMLMGPEGNMDPNSTIRGIQPLDMPSVSYGSKSEFNADQKAAEKRWTSKYGSLNNSNDGGKPGKIAPQNDPIGGGYTADYNPGEKGISYRYSPTSGGSVSATSGGEIRGNQKPNNGGAARDSAIRNRLMRNKQGRSGKGQRKVP